MILLIGLSFGLDIGWRKKEHTATAEKRTPLTGLSDRNSGSGDYALRYQSYDGSATGMDLSDEMLNI